MFRPKTPNLSRLTACCNSTGHPGTQEVKAIQNEILRIQALRKDLLRVFENDEFQHSLRSILEGKEIQEVDRFFAATQVSSSRFPAFLAGKNQYQLDFAFETIAQNCAREAASLSQGQVLISILGEMKVGKSTLCNAILGQNLLPVETAPCTSVNCIISSGSGHLQSYQPQQQQSAPNQISPSTSSPSSSSSSLASSSSSSSS